MLAVIATAITTAYGSGWVAAEKAIADLEDAMFRRRLTVPDPTFRAGVKTLSDGEARSKSSLTNFILGALDLATITGADVSTAVTELLQGH